MYDVDGNGVIDQEEMTKIVQVEVHSKKYCYLPWKHCRLRFKLSQVENTNKSISAHIANNLLNKVWKWWQNEMFATQAIYDMLGAGAVKPTDTAEERAKNIFNRWDIDIWKLDNVEVQ